MMQIVLIIGFITLEGSKLWAVERLFRALVAKGAQVTHTSCCANGATTCRFEITLSRKII